MYNRFYSFGCSFTHYIWPTWADIIAIDTGIPFENWGASGSGNQCIQSRIVECDLTNNLDKDDLVIVVWSGWNREDRYIKNRWNLGGYIFNFKFYDEDYLKKYWAEENDYIKNVTAIHTTRKAYKDVIKYEGAITLPEPGINESAGRIAQPPVEPGSSLERIKNVYYDKIKKPELFSLTFEHASWNNACNDGHPDILRHLRYVEEQVYPNMGLTIKQSTKDLCNEYFDYATKILKFEDSRDMLYEKIKAINKHFNIEIRDQRGL